MRGRLCGALLAVSALLTPAVTRAQANERQPAARADLEAELRRGFARAVRRQVGLTEEQMRRLGGVTQRFATQRRQLQADERAARGTMQRLLRDSTPPDSAVVEATLRRLLDVQRRRVQLFEAEHAELAKFMSPVQRARFFALQEQLRRRLEQRRMRRDPDPPPRP